MFHEELTINAKLSQEIYFLRSQNNSLNAEKELQKVALKGFINIFLETEKSFHGFNEKLSSILQNTKTSDAKKISLTAKEILDFLQNFEKLKQEFLPKL